MHFTVKLKQMDACKDAVKWCLDYGTLPEAWKACKDGNRMDWLMNKTGKWTPEKKATYRATIGPAYATYEAVKDQAWATYRAVQDQAWATYRATIGAYATYKAVRDQAGATYEAVKKLASATFEATISAAKATYEAECADVIGALFPNPPKI
jgi:hypothetical protein